MRIVHAIIWWSITLAFLFVIDDLTFGPMFWALALVSPVLSTIVAFVASIAFQLVLVREVLRPQRKKIVQFFLRRLLMEERANPEIEMRERSIKRRAASITGAIVVTPLLGGVIPISVLKKQGDVSENALNLLALPLAVMYATEFALIHGGYGIGAIARWLV